MDSVTDGIGPSVEGGFKRIADREKRDNDHYGNQGRDQAVLDGGNAIVLLDERFQPDQSISVY